MTPSDRLQPLIKEAEGYSATAYHDDIDPPHIWTIGWGTIMYPDGTMVKQGDTCTEEQAQEWLDWEINQKAETVIRLLKQTPVNQGQFDALVDFAYNEGEGHLATSTLLRKLLINPHDPTIYKYAVENGRPVPDSCEFLRWVRADGNIQEGLVTRRATEADWYGEFNT